MLIRDKKREVLEAHLPVSQKSCCSVGVHLLMRDLENGYWSQQTFLSSVAIRLQSDGASSEVVPLNRDSCNVFGLWSICRVWKSRWCA